jgi:hypothetical protein
MPISQHLLQSVTSGTPQQAWSDIANHLWEVFSVPVPAAVADAEIVKDYRTKPDRTKMTQAAISIQAQ